LQRRSFFFFFFFFLVLAQRRQLAQHCRKTPFHSDAFRVELPFLLAWCVLSGWPLVDSQAIVSFEGCSRYPSQTPSTRDTRVFSQQRKRPTPMSRWSHCGDGSLSCVPPEFDMAPYGYDPMTARGNPAGGFLRGKVGGGWKYGERWIRHEPSRNSDGCLHREFLAFPNGAHRSATGGWPAVLRRQAYRTRPPRDQMTPARCE